MKKKVALVAAALVTIGASSAQAAMTVTATPTKNIPQKNASVAFTFKGLPTTHGVYIEECMTPANAMTQPTACDSDQSAQAWASTVKADIAQGASNAGKPVILKPVPYFAKGDCVHAKCEFVIVGDHNAPTDMSVNRVIPFTFAQK